MKLQILYKRFPSNTHVKVVRKRQKQVVEKHRTIAFATSWLIDSQVQRLKPICAVCWDYNNIDVIIVQ